MARGELGSRRRENEVGEELRWASRGRGRGWMHQAAGDASGTSSRQSRLGVLFIRRRRGRRLQSGAREPSTDSGPRRAKAWHEGVEGKPFGVRNR